MLVDPGAKSVVFNGCCRLFMPGVASIKEDHDCADYATYYRSSSVGRKKWSNRTDRTSFVRHDNIISALEVGELRRSEESNIQVLYYMYMYDDVGTCTSVPV